MYYEITLFLSSMHLVRFDPTTLNIHFNELKYQLGYKLMVWNSITQKVNQASNKGNFMCMKHLGGICEENKNKNFTLNQNYKVEK